MRSLTKGPEPAILSSRIGSWLHEYLTALGLGKSPRGRWGYVVRGLAQEAEFLCMYCEGRFDAFSYANVEHILPKAKFPTLVYNWLNLGYACGKCNTAKSDFYDPTYRLLNPYAEQVEKYLVWIGPLVTHVHGSLRAQATIHHIQLGRPELMVERAERIRVIDMQLETWNLATGPRKDLAASLLREDADSGSFRSCVRSYLLLRGFPPW